MKKIVALFLAMVMLLSMASFAAAEEPFVITVMVPEFTYDADYVEEGNPILAKIEELTGVRLKMQFMANEGYGDTVSTTMTENNPPMVMAVTDARAPIIVDSARAGAFWDLTDFVNDAENYPYLAAGSPAVYQNIAVDGRVYGIFRGRAFPRAGVYYRLDIAKEAGFDKEVKTLDDLTELAEALAKYSDDTYALNMCSYTAGTINVITVAMGAPNVWGIDVSLGHYFDWGLTLKLNYAWMHETGNVVFSQFSQPRSHALTWRIGYGHRYSRFYALDAALSGRSLGKPQSGHTDVDQGYTIWKLMLQHHIWRGFNLNTAIDNLFNYKPKSYYYSSPLTTGTSFTIGLSVDLDNL